MIRQAFVLGAGLGTRLRPLTDRLPKPLVPIFQKPLITFAFDHLIDSGCTKLIVNTHHCPEAYADLAPPSSAGVTIQYRFEPELLETGGGIANVSDLVGDEPFLVYNGDILADLPLAPLLAEHARSGNTVTLALRSSGGPVHIGFDASSGRIVDIRDQLGTGTEDNAVFTGIYAVQPEFLGLLVPGVRRSVIPTFLELIRAGDGQLGGVVIDDGRWWDVGTRAAYRQLHQELPQLDFPRYPVSDRDWRVAIHPSARIESDVAISGATVVGARAKVGQGARLENTIVWPDAQIASRSRLRNCIVRSHSVAHGDHDDIDI